MRLIINADDFGFDDDTVDTTVRGLEDGGITSATVMVSMPAAARAITYALQHQHFSFGLHLTLAGNGSERPVVEARKVQSLVDSAGCFLSVRALAVRVLSGRLCDSELDLEIRTQLSVLRDNGIKISHVDSHGHVHKLPPIHEALRRVLPEFGISRVRNVQNLYMRRRLISPTYWIGPVFRNRVMRSFTTTRNFYMPTGAPDIYWDKWITEIKTTGDTEVGVHPGSAAHVDRWRHQEFLAAIRVAKQWQTEGRELITWNDVEK